MSRRIRFLVFTLLASFALGTAACASPTAASLEQCDVQNSSCFQAGSAGSGT